MGIIPFIGDDDEEGEEGFNNKFEDAASSTELSRAGTPEDNSEVADMHKRRSKKAFEDGEQFSGSNSEWRKVSDGSTLQEDDQDEAGLSREKLGLSSEPEESGTQEKDDLQQDQAQENLDRQQESAAVEEMSNNTQQQMENLEDQQDVPQQRPQPEEGSPEQSSEDESLENNIEAIKQQIDGNNKKNEPVQNEASGDKSSESAVPSRSEVEEEIEGLSEKVEQVMENFDVEDGEVSLDVDAVTEDELEDLKDDIAEDLTGFRDTLHDIESRQEALEERYNTLEDNMTEASEEGIHIDDIDTVERLESLEDEIQQLREAGDSENASGQIHMKALENEVKELRTDVRELSEAVVTISEKVFRQ